MIPMAHDGLYRGGPATKRGSIAGMIALILCYALGGWHGVGYGAIGLVTGIMFGVGIMLDNRQVLLGQDEEE